MEKKRIEFIDYLKAICVFMVIITHYDWGDKSTPFFTMLINMAVPVFMILTGYNFAMSNRRKTDGRLSQMYHWKVMRPKLVRFLIPFFAVCLMEIGLLYIEGKNINLPRIFLEGAYGPGSYYVPIMIQLLIIFPILYFFVEKNAKAGLIFAAAANLLYEVLVVVLDMERYYYRLCVGRYIFLIALGCYLYLHPEHRVKRSHMAAMFLVGFSYIVAVLWMDRDTTLFHYWTPTAMPIAFYIFPIVIVLFRVFYHSVIPGMIGRFLSLVGKASYHIFLIQMVYYHFELGGPIMNEAWQIAVPVNLVLSVAGGLLFYELDNQITTLIRNMRARGKRTYA